MKLTPKDIVEIKCALSRNVPQSRIAKIFKIHKNTVWKIANDEVPMWINVGNAPTWNLHDTVNEVL